LRIVLTGATGFLGQHVLDVLLNRGHEVLVAGRRAPKPRRNLTFVECDLLNTRDYDWLHDFGPTHLQHLAWYAEHGKFWESPLNLAWSDATIRLVDAFCDSGGRRAVIAGSCAEYDWSFGYCLEQRTPTNPRTLYGISKDNTRRVVEQQCARRNVEMAWGRIFIPVGMGEDSRRLVPAVMDGLLGRIPAFEINLGQWRDFLPVEDVADAFAFLSDAEIRGPVNIASGRPIEIREIVVRIAEFLDKEPEVLLCKGIHDVPPPRLLVGDNTALLNAGWDFHDRLWDRIEMYTQQRARKLQALS